MKNSKQNQPGIDLLTPIYEIFHEICMILADLGKELLKFAFRKIFKRPSPLEKIERKALNVKKTTDIKDALGIDTRTKKIFPLSEVDFRRHTFIVGASGFGKTNLITILQENALKKERPIIFFDPKGDIEALETFKNLCESYNRKCFIFSEHYKKSISLNPLLEGSINQVSDRIMRCFEWSNTYYMDCCTKTLNKVLLEIQNDNRPFTIKRIYDYYERHLDKDNSGLHTKLENILLSDFGPILSDDNALTFSQVREMNACLYIGLSTQGYGETAIGIGKLFLGELLHNSYKSLTNAANPKAGLENPISVYFDEFGSLVTPGFIELQNKCRGAGIELNLAVQTASDIDRVNPDLTKQIMENSGNMFILKQRLQSNASDLAEAIGTTLSKKQTYRIENGEQLAAGSEREVHELLVHPDIIKNLRIGQCILLRQGPTQINLINVRNRELDRAVKLIKELNNKSKEHSIKGGVLGTN